MLSIGPGAESVGIQLWAAAPGAGRWDRSAWDGGSWGTRSWQDVGCDVAEAVYAWGAREEAGILSAAAAGELDLATHDAARELDPINTASPFYGYVKPGTPVRVVGYALGTLPGCTGIIDEASYDLASERGRIRAVDGIAYLAQAQLPEGLTLPNTLRARVRAIVAAVGLGGVVPVQGEEPPALQLVTNGSFETGSAGLPTGWTLAGVYTAGGTGMQVEPGGAPDGTIAYRMQGAGASPRLEQRVPVSAGATYTISGWLYWPTGGTVPPSLQLLGKNEADGNVGAPVLATAVGRDAWEYVSATYAIPAETTISELVAGPRINGTTTAADLARFDAVSVTVADPAYVLEPDPPVAPHDGKSRPAWAAIVDAAQDALWYVWLDPLGMLRFRSFGSFPGAALSVGCEPADPSGLWLVGISTLESTSSADAIRNTIRAESAPDVWAPAIVDPVSVAGYGPRPFEAERVVPDRSTWAARILADRGDAGLEVAVGELRPYTPAELRALLELNAAGPSILRVRDDAHGEIVDLDVGILGARVGITPAGWRFAYVTMIPRVEWDAIEPAPPEPEPPPPDPWHTETRVYTVSSDALIALTSGGAKYGAGASSSLPVGAWSGWTYRSLLAFPAIPWTKVRALKTATLKVRTSSQVRVGFGSSPKVSIQRVTSGWSAGSSSTPSGSNAVVWPGPSTTSAGAVTLGLGTSENADRTARVDAIARAWAPASIGGSGAKQYGLELREVSSSTANTAEVWPYEAGAAARATLTLELEVFD